MEDDVDALYKTFQSLQKRVDEARMYVRTARTAEAMAARLYNERRRKLNDFKSKISPRLRAESCKKSVLRPYWRALEGLEGFSHLWILWCRCCRCVKEEEDPSMCLFSGERLGSLAGESIGVQDATPQRSPTAGLDPQFRPLWDVLHATTCHCMGMVELERVLPHGVRSGFHTLHDYVDAAVATGYFRVSGAAHTPDVYLIDGAVAMEDDAVALGGGLEWHVSLVELVEVRLQEGELVVRGPAGSLLPPEASILDVKVYLSYCESFPETTSS